MFQINKFPICIISAPRTSSTALTDYIVRSYQDKIQHTFHEPANLPLDQRQNFFERFFLSDFYLEKNYIIKFHDIDRELYPGEIYRYLIHSPEVFRIRIRRQNFIKQLASYYIAKTLGKWYYSSNETVDPYSVPINIEVLKGDYNVIQRANRRLNKIPRVDLDLWHEEINNLPSAFYVPTPLPLNYNDLIYEIQKMHGAASRDRT